MIHRLLDGRANRVTVFTSSVLSIGSWLVFLALKVRQQAQGGLAEGVIRHQVCSTSDSILFSKN
jgi:hypothetical protein